MDGRWMWAFAALGVGVSVAGVGARVGGVGVGSASAARVRSCPARAARRRVPPTGHRRGGRPRAAARRPPGRPAGVAWTGCGLAADHTDSVAHRGPALRRVPHVERPVEEVETRAIEPLTPPCKSDLGVVWQVGLSMKPILTWAFAIGRCRVALAVLGGFADYLRTICGLTADWPPLAERPAVRPERSGRRRRYPSPDPAGSSPAATPPRARRAARRRPVLGGGPGP
jgi:hypothetical protein